MDQLLSGANADQSWDDFDPRLYVEKNYHGMHEDDRRILQLVRDYFGQVMDSDDPVPCGIDVGSGANLYPSLSMLPFCERLVLWERGLNNVVWLQDEVRQFSPMWDEYWTLLTKRTSYDRYENPRRQLRERATVLRRNLFRLPEREWSMGTMFFVAESISNQKREFGLAVEKFIGSLKPGAPFAAAFMDRSTGYTVGSLHFPAVAVSEVDVDQCLAPLVDDLKIVPIRRSEKPLRDGYEGMLLALGKAGQAKG